MNRCKEYHRRDTVFLPHLMQWHMILICPVTDDIHLNHLIKVISVRFLYHVDIFPIEMNMNLVGGYIHILNIFHSWLYFQCIYSFIDICMVPMAFSFIPCTRIHYYHCWFWCQNSFRYRQWENLLQVGSAVLLKCSHVSLTTLFSTSTRCPKFILYFTWANLRLSHFNKKLRFLLDEMTFRSQKPWSRYDHCALWRVLSYASYVPVVKKNVAYILKYTG